MRLCTFLSSLFMLYFQSSYNDPRARVYMWLSSTILSSRNVENFENSTAILRQTCSKVAEICLLLKSCSKFLYYKSNRGIRTQSHFSATFPKGTLDSLVSGYLRQKYDLLSRTVEILKLPAFFWISFCKALLLSAGLEKSHEAHSNQSNAIIGLLHWATSKSYPNRHLSCLLHEFSYTLITAVKMIMCCCVEFNHPGVIDLVGFTFTKFIGKLLQRMPAE